MSKGIDFENCLIYEAQKRIGRIEDEYQKKYDASNSEVKNSISSIMDKIIEDVRPMDEVIFYSTFRKVSGKTPEPKTDVIFESSGEKYKCSMKWGKTFQLSSAGIAGTRELFSKVITEKLVELVYNEEKGKSSQSSQVKKLWGSQYDNLNDLRGLLSEIDSFVGESGGKFPSKISVSEFENTYGRRLQYALGFSKQPDPTGFYGNFKLKVLKEFLTGSLTFEGDSDKIANYVLTGPNYKLEKITNEYVKKVSNHSKIRISSKPRSGRHEIVIRVDAKDS